MGEQFRLLKDFYTFTVPKNYVPKDEFYGVAFPSPSWVFEPGQEVWIRMYGQIDVNTVTRSRERMDFLNNLGARCTGAHGVNFLIDNIHHVRKLPGGFRISSLDETRRLLKESGELRVPWVGVNDHGKIDHGLGFFDRLWGMKDAFFAFNEVFERRVFSTSHL